MRFVFTVRQPLNPQVLVPFLKRASHDCVPNQSRSPSDPRQGSSPSDSGPTPSKLFSPASMGCPQNALVNPDSSPAFVAKQQRWLRMQGLRLPRESRGSGAAAGSNEVSIGPCIRRGIAGLLLPSSERVSKTVLMENLYEADRPSTSTSTSYSMPVPGGLPCPDFPAMRRSTEKGRRAAPAGLPGRGDWI